MLSLSVFLLGEDVIVMPVIEEGATTRKIYIPKGRWVDGNNGDIYDGPASIECYRAPIEILPLFIREGSEAHRLLQKPM